MATNEVLIPVNSLPHVFGTMHDLIKIPLLTHELSILKNNGFWNSENIESITALVGKNGTGKSSIFNFIKEAERSSAIGDLDKKLIISYSPLFEIVSEIDESHVIDLSKYRRVMRDSEDQDRKYRNIGRLHQTNETLRQLAIFENKPCSDLLNEFGICPISEYIIKENYNIDESIFVEFHPNIKKLVDNYEDVAEFYIRNSDVTKKEAWKKLRFVKSLIYRVFEGLRCISNEHLTSLTLEKELLLYLENELLVLREKDPYNYAKKLLNNLILTYDDKKIKVFNGSIDSLISKYSEYIDKSQGIGNVVSRNDMKELIELQLNFDKNCIGGHLLMSQFPLLFVPTYAHSSGEQKFLEIIGAFFDVENSINNKGRFDHIEDKSYKNKEELIILLDEPELGFHPSWKVKLVNALISFFSSIFKEKQIQILIATHDPFILSDLPNSCVILLNSINGQTIIKEKSNNSFAGNIADLYIDSFFLDSGVIGEFAKSKIDEIIGWCNTYDKESQINEETIMKIQYYRVIVSNIGEIVLKLKLTEMLDAVTNNDILYNQMIDSEIQKLQKLKK